MSNFKSMTGDPSFQTCDWTVATIQGSLFYDDSLTPFFIGDSVLGLDLKNSNVNNPELEKMSAEKIPDVVLIKKVYGDKALRNRRRRWRLKRMDGLPHMDTESCNNEYVGFMEDIEEDPAMRQFINIYKDKERPMPVDEDDEVGADTPQVTLAEMLDDLDLAMDTTDGDGDDVLED